MNRRMRGDNRTEERKQGEIRCGDEMWRGKGKTKKAVVRLGVRRGGNEGSRVGDGRK